MINSSFVRYEVYQDSEVAWIDEIPAHWAVKRLKDVGKSIIGITYSPTDVVGEAEGILVLRASNIQNGQLSLLDNVYVNQKIRPNQIVKIGDILLCSRSGSRDLIGKNICIDEGIAGCTFGAFMTVYRSQHYKFISKFFNSSMFEAQSGLFMTSTINQLTSRTLNNLFIILPSASEQKAIADYLDTQTVHIDRKIDLLTQKAGKYRELRQILINETVTRGLDKMAAMKDSGVEQIEKIPSHWSISRIKEKGTVHGRVGWKALKASEYVDVGYILLSTPNIKNQEIDFTNVNFITHERYIESPEIMLRRDDILLVKDGSTLGIVNIIESLPRAATVNSSIAVLRFDKTIFNKYIFYQLESEFIQDKIRRKKSGMGVPHLFQQDINNIILLLPPLSEQKAIAYYLDEKTAHIDQIITTINHQIEKLQELRKTLINEVVTGQIKVI